MWPPGGSPLLFSQLLGPLETLPTLMGLRVGFRRAGAFPNWKKDKTHDTYRPQASRFGVSPQGDVSRPGPSHGSFWGHGKIEQIKESARDLTLANHCSAALMGKTLLALTIPILACLLGSAAAPLPKADAQGWNGSGWYLTNTIYPGTRSEDEPAFILFDGPYPLQNGCLEIYDRLYSPIGVCRFLNLKPAAFTG
jgi:hypothetical protein